MPDTSEFIATRADRILVTGANGFIGARVVDCLLQYGFDNVRCLVRSSSRLDALERTIAGAGAGSRVEIVRGDLMSRADCERAADGVSVVYHLAAGFDKSFAGAFMNSALTTRNLIEAFLDRGRPKRFVNVSSFAVYSNCTMRRGALLDETAPLETAPQQRHDAYAFGKLSQEQIVCDYGKRRGLKYAILRPGTVFGPGKKDLSGRIGVDTFGVFLHIGGGNALPLTYVDNCAEAVVLAGLVPGVDGEVFNIVDDEVRTSRQFLRAYKSRVRGFRSIRLPYALAYGLSALWEEYSEWSQGQLPAAFNRRRAAAEWKGNTFSNQKARQRLGWKPRVSMPQALERFLGQFGRPS